MWRMADSARCVDPTAGFFLFCALVDISTIEPFMRRNRAKAVFFRSAP